jgi:divalent metal cation (Fe/Co/Zn/Cd) transporter
VERQHGGKARATFKANPGQPVPQHPFGYGQELYFWGLIVAVVLFSLGGGVSVYEGFVHLVHPRELQNVIWNYAVLGIVFAFEGTSWFTALRELLSGKRNDQSLWRAVRAGKDVSVYTVLAEDTAALPGLIVAFLGVYPGHRWDSPVPDGIASIAIGAILMVVAIFLAQRPKPCCWGSAPIGRWGTTHVILPAARKA